MHFEDHLKALSARFDIVALYVFGSRATEIVSHLRGQEVSPEVPESDVDIGVQPAVGRRLAAEERVRLTLDLEDLLGVKRVDLIVLPEADPFLALDVVRGELLCCADPDAQAEEELYVLRRAADLAPYAHEGWRLILGGTTP